MAQDINPQEITLRGRLSFPNLTIPQALAQNKKSKFPKADEDVRPNFQLLVTDDQQDKLIAHVKNVFLPWCLEQGKAGAKSGLTEAQVKKLTKILDAKEWDVDPLQGLLKPVHEKTAALAPETVACIPVNGFKGRDIKVKAVVKSEAQLANPHSDILIPPAGKILDIEDTKLELRAGYYVGATLNLFAYTGANVGISASTETIVLLNEAEPFGGGSSFDEDVFMDLVD